ncbi:MAG: prepilin peptidase [Candidatus Riflebacteria bacterium]|nr:prepilin peptidase [Candidatus Riflebacteria bacterium]
MPDPVIILKGLALSGAFVAMITDMRTGKIFNWMTFPLMAAGLVLNLVFFGLKGFGTSIAAFFLGIVFYTPFAAIGAVGMGDVKLMAAIGALGGLRFVTTTFLYTSVIGIPHVMLVQYLNYGKNAMPMLLASLTTGAYKNKTITAENQDPTVKIHYRLGVDIFIGCLFACLIEIPISL